MICKEAVASFPDVLKFENMLIISNEELREKLHIAIQAFLDKDKYLIQHNLSERSLTHKLAEHLQSELPNHCVDCEYNKFEKIDKFLNIDRKNLSARLVNKYKERISSLAFEELLAISTYPDIIVHTRGPNGPHLLIVEVKKAHGEPDDLDYVKLSAFTEQSPVNPYAYQLGVSIRIKTNNNQTNEFTVEYPKLVWFVDGKELPDNPV